MTFYSHSKPINQINGTQQEIFESHSDLISQVEMICE